MGGRNVNILSDGLLLECRKVLLPWNATLAELLVLGSPLVEGSDLCLKWANACILDGLTVSCVSADTYSPGLCRITCQPTHYATDYLEPEFDHLGRLLGQSTKIWHCGYGAMWQLGKVRVELRIHSCNEFMYTESYHKWLHIECDVSSLKRERKIPPFPYDEGTNGIRLPADVERQLRRLVSTGRRAEAINIVNKLTEARLRAGLQVVENYLDGLAAAPSKSE